MGKQGANISSDNSSAISQKESVSEVQSPVPDRSTRDEIPWNTQQEGDTCPYYLQSRSKSRDELSLGQKLCKVLLEKIYKFLI